MQRGVLSWRKFPSFVPLLQSVKTRERSQLFQDSGLVRVEWSSCPPVQRAPSEWQKIRLGVRRTRYCQTTVAPVRLMRLDIVVRGLGLKLMIIGVTNPNKIQSQVGMSGVGRRHDQGDVVTVPQGTTKIVNVDPQSERKTGRSGGRLNMQTRAERLQWK